MNTSCIPLFVSNRLILIFSNPLSLVLAFVVDIPDGRVFRMSKLSIEASSDVSSI